jgi:NitT/TauT family transport system substrate-binding protein
MKHLFAGLMLVLFAGQAMAEDKASLRLNWIVYGFHTPFYLGVQRGYYREQGIDLTIGEGKGSASTVQVVASGGDTFGLSDSSSIITGVVRGAAVRAVMSITNRSPYTVEVRRDAGSPSSPISPARRWRRARARRGWCCFRRCWRRRRCRLTR